MASPPALPDEGGSQGLRSCYYLYFILGGGLFVMTLYRYYGLCRPYTLSIFYLYIIFTFSLLIFISPTGAEVIVVSRSYAGSYLSYQGSGLFGNLSLFRACRFVHLFRLCTPRTSNLC